MRSNLAHVEVISKIEPIKDADFIELATVLGWHVIINKKDGFKVGDKCIYIEIDSIVDTDRPEFKFLEARGKRIRTMKMRGVYSQGLIMPMSAYGSGYEKLKVGDDVTDHFGIIHYEEYLQQKAEKSKEKKYSGFRKFLWTHKFLRPIGVWLGYWKSEKKEIVIREYPYWVIKTDEERIQNIPEIIGKMKDYCAENNVGVIATEKIDGTSATYTLHTETKQDKKHRHKSKYYGFEYWVCSRNMSLDPNGDSIYAQFGNNHNMEEILMKLFNELGAEEYITIQGELIDPTVQKNKYALKQGEQRLFVFNLIKDGERCGTDRIYALFKKYGIDLEIVPIVSNFELKDTVDEILLEADGDSVVIPKDYKGTHLREGLVIRTGDGKLSFKAVSNKFLVKHSE